MPRKQLGQNGPLVTDLCFGTLPMGPLQVDTPVEEGAELISYALDRGINFIDTAAVYKTYPYIKKAIAGRKRSDYVIASKSKGKDRQEMEQDIKDGLTELGIEYFDIFHLHAARVKKPFEDNKEALECLVEYKQKGLVRAVGIATHYVKVVREAADRDDIDVIFAIINKNGMGIIDGQAEDMLEALEYAHSRGKGVYAMKPLAGGNLIDELEESINYVRRQEFITSTAIGMVSRREVDMNLMIFSGEGLPAELKGKTKELKKLRISSGLCIQCGNCIDECPNFALTMGENSAVVDVEKCILCGYCSRVCPQFCIRLA